MGRIWFVSTAALALVLGIAVPANAQPDQHANHGEKHAGQETPARQDHQHGQGGRPVQQQHGRAQQQRQDEGQAAASTAGEPAAREPATATR